MRIRAVALDLGHTVMDERLDVRDAVEHREEHLMPGVRAALAGITLPVAIWANTRVARNRDVRAWLQRAALDSSIRWIVTSVDAGARKPAREFFDYALRMMGMIAPEVVFIGNQLTTDVAGGAAAGIRTVLLTDPCYRSDDDQPLLVEPTFTISTLHELPALIAELER